MNDDATPSDRIADAAARVTARERLATDHWNYFESHVLGLIYDWAHDALTPDLSRTIMSNLAIPRRFRTSEPCFAVLSDLELLEDPGAAPLMASLELAQAGRLALDDVLDEHTARWNVPSLWAQFGTPTAIALSNMLWSGAAAMLSASIAARPDPSVAAEAHGTLSYARAAIDRAVLTELQFSRSRSTFEEYEFIATAKNRLGQAVPRLVSQVFYGSITHLDTDALARAFERIDLAASITNDLTETHGRRGRAVVRLPTGEERGQRSEIQLSRPTIFTVFFGTDEYLVWLKQTGESDFALDLAALDRGDISDALNASGAVQFAQTRADQERASAARILSTLDAPWRRTAEFLLRGLKANMPSVRA